MATITDTTTDANGNTIVNVSSSTNDSITLATAGTYFNKNIQNGNKADLTVLGEEINAIEHIASTFFWQTKEIE